MQKIEIEGIRLKGKVKFLEEKTYYTIRKFGEIKKGKLKSSSLTSFNEDGNELIYIFESKKSYVKNINIYNSNGYIFERNSYNSDGILKSRGTYRYDSNRHII